jgi:hypothetical protein
MHHGAEHKISPAQKYGCKNALVVTVWLLASVRFDALYLSVVQSFIFALGSE